MGSNSKNNIMHIGFITPEYPIEQFKKGVGGIGTFIHTLALSLVKQEIKVSIFIHSQDKNDRFEIDGVTIYSIKKETLKGFTWLRNRLYFNKYVNKIIKSENINIIEAPEWTGFTAFMKFNCPLVIRLHGSDTFFCHLENRKVKFKNYWYERIALKKANKIIGVSDFVSIKTKELFKLNEEITTIYNAIDTSKFKPNHKNIKPKTLLYFGSVIRKKGVLEIAKMFNELYKYDTTIKLTYLGKDTNDVKENRSTIEIIKSLVDSEVLKNINFVSAVPYFEVRKYICNSEIILLPSFAEAFPMSWLEAMSMEKKLITSNIGWANELMIHQKTGLMVDPKKTDIFKDYVVALLQNTKDTLHMSIEARKRIKIDFELNDIVQKNVEFYKYTVNEI